MASQSELARVFHRFSSGCDVGHTDIKGLVSRFLSLQVNLANWENVYTHATKEDGGKDVSSFKYHSKEGVVDTYTRTDRGHQFKANFWRELFKGATLEPSDSKNFQKQAAGYIGFCQQVCDPISKDFGEDQRLMLYFLLNAKEKNLRQIVHDSELGLGLRKDKLTHLLTKMSQFQIKEDKNGSLAKEIGTIISSMNMPVAANGSRLQMELRSMNGVVSSAPIDVPRNGDRRLVNAQVRMERGEERKKENMIFSIKGSREEGWTAKKERDVIDNPVVKEFRNKMNIRFAPAKELAAQILVSTLSPKKDHWSMVSGGELVNGKLDLTDQFRQNIGELAADTDNWRRLLQVVGYNKSKHLSTTPDVMTFYKHLASAIPQRERKEWTSKELVQRFITAHLPNWEQHWTASWTMDPKIKRAVSTFIQENPHPSSTFIETLINSF